MAGVKVLDTRNPLKATSLNTILSWFNQDKKTKADVTTLFHEQGWFHRCVDLRAKTIQNMPWSITTTGSDKPIWSSDDAQVPDELAFVEQLPRFLYMWEAALVTVGKAYTLKESDGQDDGLHYFNPIKIEPVKTKERGIVAYKRQVNGEQEIYSAEDMIALFHPDPFVENGPASQQAGLQNARVLRALDGFLVSFLDKGLIKATILSVEGGEHAQPEQLEKLKKSWKKTLAGWFNGGDQHIFNSKIKPIPIGEGLNDLSDAKLTKDQREAVCAALGIPLSLMMGSAANFATAEQDHVNYYSFTAIPEAKFLMRELNKQLFSPAGYELTFHPERLEIIQRYELDKAAKVVQVVGAPVLTQDEGRELLGYQPLGASEIVIDAREEEPAQISAGDEDMSQEDEQKAIEDIVRRVLEEQKPKEVVTDWKVAGGDLLYAVSKGTGGVVEMPVINHGITSYDADLKNWRRKISKKDNRQVKFNPDHLSAYETAIIKQRLETDMPLDEVFDPPFVGF